MQNKPNFRQAGMNTNSVITSCYENYRLRGYRQNKPKSKPKQSQNFLDKMMIIYIMGIP
jgi:hypothetical protein